MTREQITEQLSAVGFTDEMLEMVITSLSGGWKMKLALARAMLMKVCVYVCGGGGCRLGSFMSTASIGLGLKSQQQQLGAAARAAAGKKRQQQSCVGSCAAAV